MKYVIWGVQILLALAFLFVGSMKLITAYSDLIADPSMAWAQDFSATQIKLIGSVEVLGALGVILPMLLKKFQFLVPIAAAGLGVVMLVAAYVHIGRGEPIVSNLVLFALAAFTAWGRRGLLKGATE